MRGPVRPPLARRHDEPCRRRRDRGPQRPLLRPRRQPRREHRQPLLGLRAAPERGGASAGDLSLGRWTGIERIRARQRTRRAVGAYSGPYLAVGAMEPDVSADTVEKTLIADGRGFFGLWQRRRKDINSLIMTHP